MMATSTDRIQRLKTDLILNTQRGGSDLNNVHGYKCVTCGTSQTFRRYCTKEEKG